MSREIINTFDQLRASGGGIAIIKAYGGIREHYVSGWYVYRVSAAGVAIQTDPAQSNKNIHRGLRWFPNFDYRQHGHATAQRQSFEDARRWVKDQGWYDGPWVGNAMGDKVPAAVNKQFPIRRQKPLAVSR